MTDHNASDEASEADLPTVDDLVSVTDGKGTRSLTEYKREKEVAEKLKGQPQPVVNNQLISGFATLLVGGLIAYLARNGILLPDGADDFLVSIVSAGGTALVGLLLGYVAAIRARSKVTPLDSPKDDEGKDLVPAGSESATDIVQEYWEEHPGDPINEQN